MSKPSRGRRQTIAISLFIIAVCLGLGVYALMGGGGNNLVADAVDGPRCDTAPQRAVQLADLATGDMSEFQPTTLPQDFSSIAFKTGDGEDKTLGDWQGKAVYLNLWATWCGPCRHEMPGINELAKTADDKFEVVTLSLDQGESEKPQAFLDEIGADALPLYHDNTNGVFLDLRERGLLQGLPASYVLDSSGCLLGALLGPAEWNTPDALALMEKAREL